MITSIIFSKDRALQLDLTLYTLFEKFRNCRQVVVLYKTSSKEHDIAYDQLKQAYPYVIFIEQERSFLKSCIDCLYTFQNSKYYCLLTDDIIIFDHIETTERSLDALYSRTQISCVSLRLGINTNKRDFDGSGRYIQDALPHFSKSEDYIIWNRTTIPVGGYWSSPLCVDGHIFDSKTLYNVWGTMYSWPEGCGIKAPNELETYMHRFFFEVPPVMACERYSKLVNSPNNRVQNTHKNAFGNTFSFDSEFLNKKFLEGYRIRDISNINKETVCCPHQEFDILKGVTNEV